MDRQTRPATIGRTLAKPTIAGVFRDGFLLVAAFVGLAVPGAAPAAAAVVDPELRIVIRTYDASASLGDRSPALAAAAAIFDDAGVGVTWVNCDVVFVQRDDNPCLAPLAANELAIRFIRLPAHLATRDFVTLGDSLVDSLRGGALATIYANRVATLAGRCHVDVQTLLARAVAHEIGHLLLGTSAHASSGLMRAAWTQAALRRAAAEDWTFTPPDARTLREAVRHRNARRLAAGKIGE